MTVAILRTVCGQWSKASSLEPNHHEFKKLEVHSRESLERQRKVRELAAECQQQLGAGAFEASIAAAKNLESLDPGNTVAVETRLKANEGIERHRQVKTLLARALDVSIAGDFEACHKICGEALELDPCEHPGCWTFDRKHSQYWSRVAERRRGRERVQATRLSLPRTLSKAAVSGRRSAISRACLNWMRRTPKRAGCWRKQRRSWRLLGSRISGWRNWPLLRCWRFPCSVVGSGMRCRMLTTKSQSIRQVRQTQLLPTPRRSRSHSCRTPQIPKHRRQKTRRSPVCWILSRSFIRERKYTEAEEAAGELLARSPNHREGAKIQQEARRNLEKIDEGLRQARTLFDRGQYAEVASVLSGVLAVDANHPEALQLMARVDQYARSEAQDAQKKMQEIKQRAGQAGASSLAQSQYQTATLTETEAIRLFERKRFAEATGKFYEASEGYVRAEDAARKAAEGSRDCRA